MSNSQHGTLFGCIVTALLLFSFMLFPVISNAVPVNASEKVPEKAQEQSSDRSDEAGWMRAGKVLNSRADEQKPTPSMQACLHREDLINKKILLVATEARDYEKKLTSVLGEVVELKNDSNIHSAEVDALVIVSNNLKMTQIDPLLSSLAGYQNDNKISCSKGVDQVVTSLVQIQGITQELKDGLAEYRNSIKAVLFAIRDTSEGSKN